MDITSAVSGDGGGPQNAVYPKQPQQTDIPCRVSFGNRDAPRDANTRYETQEQTATVFCDPDVPVIAGDRIALRRRFADGQVYDSFEGLVPTAGRANRYETHQEFDLELRGYA
jgi:hypothetical protein